MFWKKSLVKKVTTDELSEALELIRPLNGNADKGIDRGLKALAKKYKNDPEKLTCITCRITALFHFLEESIDLVGQKEMFKNGIPCHTAVVEAAAQHDVRRNQTFSEKSFLDRVKRIREEKYGEDVGV